MATESILKNIHINDEANAMALLLALESAKEKKSKDVILSRPYSDVRGEDIKKLFGNK